MPGAISDTIAHRFPHSDCTAVAGQLASAPGGAAACPVVAGRVTALLKKPRDKTSIEFEQGLAPKLAAFPDARVNFETQFNYGDGNGKINKPAEIELYPPKYVLINNGSSIKYFETSGL